MTTTAINPSSSEEEILTALHNERAARVTGDRISPKSEIHFHRLLVDVHTETPIRAERYHAKSHADPNGSVDIEGGGLDSLADVLSVEDVHVPIREERKHAASASRQRARTNWKKGGLAVRAISAWTAQHSKNYDEEEAERIRSEAEFMAALDAHEDPSDVVLKEVKLNRIPGLQSNDSNPDKDHLTCLSLSLKKVDRQDSTGDLFLTCDREVSKGEHVREEEIKQRIRETDGPKCHPTDEKHSKSSKSGKKGSKRSCNLW